MPRSPSSASRTLRGFASSAAGLLAVLCLAGCGDDAGGGAAKAVPLVEIVTNRLDGEPPDHDLAIRRVEQGALGKPFPLTPVAGRPRVYEARGAPEGAYVLVLPDGWGPLFVVSPPHLQADAHPAKMNAGRPHTMYLTSRALDRVLGETWAVRRAAPGGPGPPLPLKIETDGNGWVLLRLRPEDWAGPVAFQGRFADGTLTEQALTTLKERGLPILRQLDVEPAGPLRVVVVGAPAGTERWVHLSVLGLPLDEVQQRPARDGVAEFPLVATSREGLELRVGDGPGAPTYRVATAEWARDGEVRVRDVPRTGVAVRLPVPRPADVIRVQVRAEGEDSYGWVPVQAEEDVVVLTSAQGDWHVLVQTATACAAGTFRVTAGALVPPVVLGPFEEAATVRGAVTGGAGVARVLWRRVEGGRAVLGHGFVVGAGQAGAFQAVLPAGEYLLEVHGPEGARSKPKEFHLQPGHLVSVALDMPKPTDEPR